MLNKTQLAEYLNVSLTTVSRLMERGIPYYKIEKKNGAVRFDIEEVKVWLKKNNS